jgi:predicted nuclease with TOPRIM domain
MGRTSDETLQAAEAEMRRVHEVLLELEAERASTYERLDQIADESFDTKEQEAEIASRVELAEVPASAVAMA